MYSAIYLQYSILFVPTVQYMYSILCVQYSICALHMCSKVYVQYSICTVLYICTVQYMYSTAYVQHSICAVLYMCSTVYVQCSVCAVQYMYSTVSVQYNKYTYSTVYVQYSMCTAQNMYSTVDVQYRIWTVYYMYSTVYVQYSTRKEGKQRKKYINHKNRVYEQCRRSGSGRTWLSCWIRTFYRIQHFQHQIRSGVGSDFDNFYYNHNSTSYSFYEINTLCNCDLLIFYSKYLDGCPTWSDPDPEPPILKDRIRNWSIIEPVCQQWIRSYKVHDYKNIKRS